MATSFTLPAFDSRGIRKTSHLDVPRECRSPGAFSTFFFFFFSLPRVEELRGWRERCVGALFYDGHFAGCQKRLLWRLIPLCRTASDALGARAVRSNQTPRKEAVNRGHVGHTGLAWPVLSTRRCRCCRLIARKATRGNRRAFMLRTEHRPGPSNGGGGEPTTI